MNSFDNRRPRETWAGTSGRRCAAQSIESAVKNAEFSNFSMRRQHIPALDFAGIGALRAHFLANSDRGIPSNRNL
jgi:hypothetical protein